MSPPRTLSPTVGCSGREDNLGYLYILGEWGIGGDFGNPQPLQNLGIIFL